MKEEPYYLRERTRVARENLATLIIVAIGLGVVIGLSTEILSTFILKGQHPWFWFAACVLFTVFMAAYIIYRIYARGYDVESFVEVVLPFRVTPTEAEIVIARPYPVTHTAHQHLEWILSDEDRKRRFLNDWQEAREKGQQPFQGFVRQCMLDLLEYVVLDVLREYADITLSPKVIYIKHGWLPIKPALQKLPMSEWPAELKDNICFQDTSKPVFQHLQLPDEVTLSMSEHKSADQAERRDLVIESDFGKLSFSLSPYPQKISDRSRDGIVLRKYCGVPEQTELWIAKFPLRISADFGGLSVFSDRFHKSFLPWVEDLFEFVKNELDWRRCIERDLERMVVELREQVKTLLERQSGSVKEQAKGG
jgi:hypothetical protein